MSFWKNWNEDAEKLQEVVGIKEVDFDPIATMTQVAISIIDHSAMSRSSVTRHLLDLAEKNPNVQILLINIISSGFDKAAMEAVADITESSKDEVVQ